jgi:hypothetical protein
MKRQPRVNVKGNAIAWSAARTTAADVACVKAAARRLEPKRLRRLSEG